MPHTSSSEPPVIHLRNAVHCVATWRELLFHIWRSEGDAQHIAEGLEVRRNIYKTRRERSVINLHAITMPTVRPVDEAMRERMRESFRLMLPYTKASVVVITASGFAASLVRGALASILLIKKVEFPVKVMSSTDAAFRYVAPLLEPAHGRHASPEQLAAVYDHIVA